mgnify:CR=1 FL=1
MQVHHFSLQIRSPNTLFPLQSIDPDADAQQAGNDARQKAKRRSKNDGDDRNFTCGCGKSYLSYPALYTHIKTKHDGIAPEGTTQKQPGAGLGRGRPRVTTISSKNFLLICN